MTDDANAIWRDTADSDSSPSCPDEVHAPAAGASRASHRGPRENSGFDDKGRHFLQTIIRTHVFEQAKLKLAHDGSDSAGLVTTKLVTRFKQALYDRPTEADDTARPEWLINHDASMPLKLAFLEAVARALGDDWSRDASSFVDVTIAMGRLQLALRGVMLAGAADWATFDRGSALIAVPPGEQHQFGQCIVEELFRARGWSTHMCCPASENELIGRIDGGTYDIVCLSWSTDALADVVTAAIGRIEAIPAARRPAIIVGGPASRSHEGWLVRLGVDCVCDSTYGALAVAQAMLDQRGAAGSAISAPSTIETSPVQT